MENDFYYMPTVRWLTGERRAFQKEIAPTVRQKIRPLIEIAPRVEKHDEPDEKDELMGVATASDYLRALPKNIVQHLGFAPFLLDTYALSPSEKVAFGKSSLVYLTENMHELKAKAVPVLRLSDKNNAQSLKTITTHGIALRVTAVETLRGAEVTAFLRALRVGAEQVDIVIDLGLIDESSIDVNLAFLQHPGLSRFLRSREWRSCTLLGGSFPEKLTGVREGLHAIERLEWRLWLQALEDVERKVCFGDYTVSYPRPKPATGEIRAGIPTIRYTANSEWLIFRGVGKKAASAGGNQQYFELARRCSAHEAFRGRGYSRGDEYIDDCGKRHKGPGNPTVWRRIATATHITFVANETATAYDAAGGL